MNFVAFEIVKSLDFATYNTEIKSLLGFYSKAILKVSYNSYFLYQIRRT